MQVVRHADAADFLEATAGLRATEPVLTNIIGSVATGAASGRQYTSEFWYSIVDEGRVIGCAMRTAPHLLAVSPMPSGAAEALAEAVLESDPELPGVVGPSGTAQLVAQRLRRSGRVSMVELVRVLGEYQPATCDGSARPARDDEFELLVQWLSDFHTEAGLLSATEAELRETVASRTADRALLVWAVAGEPVSVAGHAPLVTTPSATVGRVGPVYTPATHRGRGYGSAITAAVVESLQPRCDVIMLFTDASNHTSNRIYERLGFVVVGEVVELQFES